MPRAPKIKLSEKPSAEIISEDYTVQPPQEDIVRPEAQEAPQKSEATVLDKSGQVARTYTAEIHGPTFADLAAQYAGKIGGSVK